MPAPDIFISYRRLDSGLFSQWLAAYLRQTFGLESAFIDVRNIRDADIWASEIKTSLSAAKVILVVIGKSWLSVSNEVGRRRIDLDDDWVRLEIELAIQQRKIIVPLLIDDAPPLTEDALPKSIAMLADVQARKITKDDILKEMEDLASEVAKILKKHVEPRLYLPAPLLRIDPLDPESLKRVEERLPGWKVMQRDTDDGQKVELTKHYLFESFEDAIHFMNAASRFISIQDHHPDWTNVWRNIIVRLTTFDIKFKPSILDVDLATYLDNLYKNYEHRISPREIEQKLASG